MDVKILCLGVLSRGQATGYEIRKAFEEGPLSHFQDAGFGSIYPSLKKLSDQGLIAAGAAGDDARPDKKVYRITAAGRQALYDALLKVPGPDKVRSDFSFVLSFADLLPPRHLDRIVEDRIAEHRACVAAMERAMKGDDRHGMTEGERFVLGFGHAINKAMLQYLEEHRHEVIGAALLTQKVAE
ncbi:MAG TPA: PadR family transcriptional regulator [Alphaproteobacteria bacterium]|nr:PadR family transcriptional regulator [Alphaproteobacteria bacterium]